MSRYHILRNGNTVRSVSKSATVVKFLESLPNLEGFEVVAGRWSGEGMAATEFLARCRAFGLINNSVRLPLRVIESQWSTWLGPLSGWPDRRKDNPT